MRSTVTTKGRIIAGLALCAATFGLLALAASYPRREAGPGLTAEFVEQSPCAVRAGELGRFALRVSNRRRTPIQVRDVKTNCGCAVAGVRSFSIERGEQVEVPILMKTGGLSKEKKEVRVMVLPDSKGVDAATAALDVRIIRGLTYEPRFLYLTDIRPGEVIRREVRFRCDNGPFKLVTAVSDTNGISVACSGNSLVVQVDENVLPEGQEVLAEVTAKTERGDLDTAKIQCYVRRSSLVEVTPVSLHFCPEENTPVRRFLMVRAGPEFRAKNGSVEVLSDAGLRWKTEARDRGILLSGEGIFTRDRCHLDQDGRLCLRFRAKAGDRESTHDVPIHLQVSLEGSTQETQAGEPSPEYAVR